MKIATKAKHDNGVGFAFENGEQVDVKLEDMSEDMIQMLAVHGLTQKLGDSYASATSVSEACEKFYDVLNNLKAGTWNGGRSATSGGIWVEAIARATGRSIEDSAAMFASKTETEQKAIKKHDSVVVAKAEITLERQIAKAKANPKPESVSVDALFA